MSNSLLQAAPSNNAEAVTSGRGDSGDAVQTFPWDYPDAAFPNERGNAAVYGEFTGVQLAARAMACIAEFAAAKHDLGEFLQRLPTYKLEHDARPDDVTGGVISFEEMAFDFTGLADLFEWVDSSVSEWGGKPRTPARRPEPADFEHARARLIARLVETADGQDDFLGDTAGIRFVTIGERQAFDAMRAGFKLCQWGIRLAISSNLGEVGYGMLEAERAGLYAFEAVPAADELATA